MVWLTSLWRCESDPSLQVEVHLRGPVVLEQLAQTTCEKLLGAAMHYSQGVTKRRVQGDACEWSHAELHWSRSPLCRTWRNIDPTAWGLPKITINIQGALCLGFLIKGNYFIRAWVLLLEFLIVFLKFYSIQLTVVEQEAETSGLVTIPLMTG